METKMQNKMMQDIHDLTMALAQTTRQSDATIRKLFGVSKTEAIHNVIKRLNELASELN